MKGAWLLFIGRTYKTINSTCNLFHSWTVCKLYFLYNHSAFPTRSYECALKLNDLFDLNDKFINGSFTFSPGYIYILSFNGTYVCLMVLVSNISRLIVCILYDICEYRCLWKAHSRDHKRNKNLLHISCNSWCMLRKNQKGILFQG